MMDTVEVERHDLEAEGAQEQQHGGHRINRRLIGVVAGGAIIVAIVKGAWNTINPTYPMIAASRNAMKICPRRPRVSCTLRRMAARTPRFSSINAGIETA